MIIETIREPEGFSQAIQAMRNPMNSWDKSDSGIEETYHPCEFDFKGGLCGYAHESFVIGQNDKELSIRLQKAGPEHCKHLRMIFVWANINGPMYWWKEFDTYRAGVEKLSCSTMHKLMSRPLTEGDFEHDSLNDKYFKEMLASLNDSILAYKLCKDPDHKKEIWRGVIQALPQSYLQKRTVCMSYAALRNIVQQRKGHKLVEWEWFIRWARSLPNSWMIFDEGE